MRRGHTFFRSPQRGGPRQYVWLATLTIISSVPSPTFCIEVYAHDYSPTDHDQIKSNQMSLPNVRFVVKPTSVTPPSITDRYQCTTQADGTWDIGVGQNGAINWPWDQYEWVNELRWEWTKDGFWDEWWMNEEMKNYVSQKVKRFPCAAQIIGWPVFFSFLLFSPVFSLFLVNYWND